MPIGLTTASFTALGLDTVRAAAQRAVDLGTDSLWVAETTGPEAFTLLAAMGNGSVGLGTGVVPIQLRTPQTVAMAAATLQALNPEADIWVGIGMSSPIITERWHGTEHGDRPIARIREYVELLRACWSGEPVDHRGDFYSARGFRLGVRLGERKPKVVLAALGPKMLELGGEVADAVLLNYLPPSHVPWSVERVRAGGDARIQAYVHLGLGERTPATDKLARRDLYGYASADAYRASFRLAGFGDEMDAFEAAKDGRDRDAQMAAISDRMIDEIDTIGDETRLGAALDAYRSAGVDDPIVMPLPWGEDRRQVLFDTIEATQGR